MPARAPASKVTSGTGVPSNAVGAAGDWFLDSAAGSWYQKVGAAWAAGVNGSGPLAAVQTLADVYIYLDSGGMAVAVDKTGSVVAKSADHASVFQAAFDSLKTGPGSTILFNGIFTWNSGVTGCCGMTLRGTDLHSSGTHNRGSVITSSYNGDLLTVVQNPTAAEYWFTLANCCVYGDVTKASQRAVVCSNANGAWKDMFVNQVMIDSAGSVGLYTNQDLKLWAQQFYLEFCGSDGIQWTAGICHLNECFFDGNVGWGVDSTSGVMEICNSYFLSNTGGAVFFRSQVDGFLSDCHIEGNGDSTHPQVQIFDSTADKGINIHDCVFRDTRGASAVTNHISVATSNYAKIGTIHDNYFSESQGAAILWSRFEAPGALNVHDNPGYNDIFGVCATPWYLTTPTVAPFTGTGTAAAPAASTTYRAATGPMSISSTGGTGVSITIKNGKGDTILSGLTTLADYRLPFGWSINFGAFSVAPTTVVSVV